jgi:hypothetical protein
MVPPTLTLVALMTNELDEEMLWSWGILPVE